MFYWFQLLNLLFKKDGHFQFHIMTGCIHFKPIACIQFLIISVDYSAFYLWQRKKNIEWIIPKEYLNFAFSSKPALLGDDTNFDVKNLMFVKSTAWKKNSCVSFLLILYNGFREYKPNRKPPPPFKTWIDMQT